MAGTSAFASTEAAATCTVNMPGRPPASANPFHAWARLALPWTLVTDDGADPGQEQKFKDAGVQVEVGSVGG